MAGRPREFVEEEALEYACEIFWQQGYEATSLSALVECMGISRQSLYNTFGGKKELFLRVVDHYQETRLAPVLSLLGDDGADLRSIEKYFGQVVAAASTPGDERKGCLMVNTTIAISVEGGFAAGKIKSFLSRLDGALLHALKGAKAAGQITSTHPLTQLASFLSTVVQGMLVSSKAGATRKQLSATAAVTLSALNP